MRIVKYFLAAVLLSMTWITTISTAQAASTDWLVPTTVTPTRDGIMVHLPGAGDPGNCGHPDWFYLVTNDTGQGIRSDQFLSMIMTAIATKTEISIGYGGCYTDTWQSSAPYNSINKTVQFGRY